MKIQGRYENSVTNSIYFVVFVSIIRPLWKTYQVYAI